MSTDTLLSLYRVQLIAVAIRDRTLSIPLLRLIIGQRQRAGQHAMHQLPSLFELIAHYVVAFVTWTRDQNGDDLSAVGRVARVAVLIAVTLLGLVTFI